MVEGISGVLEKVDGVIDVGYSVIMSTGVTIKTNIDNSLEQV